MIDKFREDVLSVVDRVHDGASIAVGGFGSSGRPDVLLDALCELDRRDLHVYVNNVGHDFTGVGRLLHEGRLRRVTASFPILQEFYDEYFAGKVELELIPQGTLAERLRAGGSGIPAFFTATGGGTQVAEGGLPWRYDADGDVVVASPAKETRDFPDHEGVVREYVLEEAIVADFGMVRAWKGDRHGNLVYRDSARNFNPLAAMCGRVTIAEVEELVEPGELEPNDVHTPGVFVQRVVALSPEQAADKRIEKRTVRPRTEA